jgi:2-polyprenyl-3-methyl-5-hydroxy-6-metoxy-1,4-benzoquinol methylase
MEQTTPIINPPEIWIMDYCGDGDEPPPQARAVAYRGPPLPRVDIHLRGGPLDRNVIKDRDRYGLYQNIEAGRPTHHYVHVGPTHHYVHAEAKTIIDTIRDWWDKHPCNLRHSAAPVGSRQYFTEVSARKFFVEPHIVDFADFGRWKYNKVLDIGCGIGTIGAAFAENGAKYTGLDFSVESLDLARKRFEVFNLEGNFLCGDAERLSQCLPSFDAYYDLIFAFGVLHHTPNPFAAVDCIRWHMTPTSEFRLMLYAHRSWKRMMIDAGLDQSEASGGCPIAQTYTEEQARELLRSYEILEIRQAHIFPYNVAAYRRYEYEKEPWFEAMPPAMFAALEKELGWHMLIRCRLKR